MAIRKIFKITPGDPMAKGAEESFKVMISLSLLLMAFCLVRTQGDHRSVEDLVSREAAVILKLDRAYTGFGGEDGAKLEQLLMLYSKSVVKTEWKLLEAGGRSDEVSAILAALSGASKSLEPKNAPQQIARAEILSAFTQLSDLREARLSASRLALPTYLWQAICLSVMCAVVLGWFQTPLPKLVFYVGGVSMALSLLATILISTSGIFVGESAVTPEPIEKAIPLLGKSWPVDPG